MRIALLSALLWISFHSIATAQVIPCSEGSIGVRAKLSYTESSFNQQGTWRPAITAGLTWHF